MHHSKIDMSFYVRLLKIKYVALVLKRDNSFLSAYNNIYALLTLVKCGPFSLAENFSEVISISKT